MVKSGFDFPRKGKKDGALWETWPEVFEPPQSMFAPGEPLSPIEDEVPRSLDFPVGINQIIYPRAPEVFGFSELKAFSNVELVRLAIETRKDQIERLDWQIRPRGDRKDSTGMPKKNRKDYLERIKIAENFFKKPNEYEDFHVWIRTIMEDLLVIDAPAVERQRTFGGSLHALPHIPGDTLKVLIDSNGRRPKPPVPAFQQIIKGRVWANLTADDILYAPRNVRSGKMYGQSPVEQTIVTINTVMRRQASQLAYFTDSTVPAGMATVPDGWTVDQTQEWQQWMDSVFGGNLAERRKLLWAPAGSKYQAFKEPPIKDDFDEWLARIVCYAFSLPPTPFIKQMNRSTAQADTERALEEGLTPLLVWAKRFANNILWNDLHFPDLEFVWGETKDTDLKTQADVNNLYLRAAVLTINEVRDTMGLDPIKDGDTPLIYTAAGATTLELVLNPPPPEPAGASSPTTSLRPSRAAPTKKPGFDDRDKAKAEERADTKIAPIEDDRWLDLITIAGDINQLRIPLMETLNRTSYSFGPNVDQFDGSSLALGA